MYYNGERILNMKDLNGNRPEIYIVDSNRSAGKTTFFNHKLVEDFLLDNKKFMLLYRYKYELDGCSKKFFNDLNKIYYPGMEMIDKKKANGIYHSLHLNGDHCGYAVALNSADAIKRNSHFFSDTFQILFDEFQSETGKYCSNEISKFISIHASVARGAGNQVRYVPVYMLGNCITILNPYYSRLGISKRIKKDTKFLRGDGFVLEHHFNETSAQLNNESLFNKAFNNSKYLNMLTSKSYIMDDSSFIGNIDEKTIYMCTFKIDGRFLSVQKSLQSDILYITDSYDPNFPVKFSCEIKDHTEDYNLILSSSPMIKNFRRYFDAGRIKFKNLTCKQDFIQVISY